MAAGLVVVALAGPTPDTALLRARIADAQLTIAADAGAQRLADLGLHVDLLTGDFDSLSPTQRAAAEHAGAEIVPHPDPQQLTDGAAALQLAVERGAETIVVLGAHGGERLDHSLGNLTALVHPRLAGVRITVVDGWSEAVPLCAEARGSVTFAGGAGDYISILAFSDRVRVRTRDLRWPLDDATLERGDSRAISNELTATRGGVDLLEGTALATHFFRPPRRVSLTPW
jgi:thiamine pyrophosphokinase